MDTTYRRDYPKDTAGLPTTHRTGELERQANTTRTLHRTGQAEDRRVRNNDLGFIKQTAYIEPATALPVRVNPTNQSTIFSKYNYDQLTGTRSKTPVEPRVKEAFRQSSPFERTLNQTRHSGRADVYEPIPAGKHTFKNGQIVAAASEERFSRKKADERFPTHAVNFCLRQAGITAQQLTHVGFYDKPLLKFERILETFLGIAPRGFTQFRLAGPLWIKDKLYIDKHLKDTLGYTFMDNENYEQFVLNAEVVGDAMQYITDNSVCTVVFCAGEALARIPRLVDLGLDCVRIDSRFVHGISADGAADARRHLQGLVRLVQAVGLQVTAEGVRHAGDLDALWRLGFDAATGPALVAEPAPAPAPVTVS